MKRIIIICAVVLFGCSGEPDDKNVDMDMFSEDMSDVKDMSSEDMIDMADMDREHRPFVYSSDEKIVSCDDHCQSVQLACDGDYIHPAFLNISGIAKYGEKTVVSLDCVTVPRAEDNGVKLTSVTCYCR